MRLTIAALFLTASFASAQPAKSVSDAVADCKKLPPELASRTRYLAMWAVPPEEREKEFVKVLNFWIQSLSRESDIIPPRRVTSDLLAVDIGDYQWDAKVWEAIASSEIYFHVTIESLSDEDEYEPLGIKQQVVENGVIVEKWVPNGQKQKTGRKIKGKRQSAFAPWADPLGQAQLGTLTGSAVPIVRADWWLVRTSQQADRNGDGYYNFLGIGDDEKDFQKLFGVDVALSKTQGKHQAAYVEESSVTHNNRSFEFFRTINGFYFRSIDFRTNTNKQNVTRLLNGDTTPPTGDASEQYASMPNGLFALFLANDQRKRQDSAPDFIAGDSRSSTPDKRVHIGISCVRCHVEGIRPVADGARELYQGDVKLSSPDYKKFQELRRLYLSDLNETIDESQKKYAKTLMRLNGFTPKANADAFAKVYSAYQDYPVTTKMFALDLGVTEESLKKSMEEYAKIKPLDPVLIKLVIRGKPIRRQYAEEVFPVAQLILAGVK